MKAFISSVTPIFVFLTTSVAANFAVAQAQTSCGPLCQNFNTQMVSMMPPNTNNPGAWDQMPILLLDYSYNPSPNVASLTSAAKDIAPTIEAAAKMMSKCPSKIYDLGMGPANTGGGPDLFGNAIYIEGFFRLHKPNMGSSLQKGIGDPLSKLSQSQLWLEINADSGSVIPHTTGAEENILNSMPGDTVTLYRGLSPKEVNEIEAFQKAQGSGDSSADPLLQQFVDIVGKSDFGGVFLTPNKQKAIGWNKGAVIQYQVPKSYLLGLSKSANVYVGIEYDYVEVALFTPETIKDYLSKAKSIAFTVPPPPPVTDGAGISADQGADGGIAGESEADQEAVQAPVDDCALATESVVGTAK